MALTYKDFFQNKIDLAPLGIECIADRVTYFCTPKGAEIFGSTGVDGIHFCFIKGFGEMVFAVSPCNDVGNHVHPIARNFEHLLSLLVSIGNIAAAEQAWMWDEENFNVFLQENPPTEEQVQTVQMLQTHFAVTTMERPFDYIKKLQAEFDYTNVKFTDEYYDVIGEKPLKPTRRKGAKKAIPEADFVSTFTFNKKL